MDPKAALARAKKFLNQTREAKLSCTNLEAIYFIYDQPLRRSTITDIARNVGVSNANGTGMVDTLEKLGLVTRASDPTDRRKIVVELSEKGRAQAEGLLSNFSPKI
jgi:DNA-binding MarR family transcriptional regulator